MAGGSSSDARVASARQMHFFDAHQVSRNAKPSSDLSFSPNGTHTHLSVFRVKSNVSIRIAEKNPTSMQRIIPSNSAAIPIFRNPCKCITRYTLCADGSERDGWCRWRRHSNAESELEWHERLGSTERAWCGDAVAKSEPIVWWRWPSRRSEWAPSGEKPTSRRRSPPNTNSKA